jgi:cystathionine beta-synthase
MVLYLKNHETGILMKMRFLYNRRNWEDILPLNVDFSLIDGFTKVTDKMPQYTREKLRWKKVFSLGTQQELL